MDRKREGEGERMAVCASGVLGMNGMVFVVVSCSAQEGRADGVFIAVRCSEDSAAGG